MKIHKIHLHSNFNVKNLNLAIGNFDGIHLGHQKVIKDLIKKSKDHETETAIMSFIPHPRVFFLKNVSNFNIISDSKKIQLLKAFGIQHFILLKFDNLIASLSADDFIEKILLDKLNILSLTVGYDFKFGKNREGDINLLKQKSLINKFQLNIVQPEKLKKTSEIFSSSLIRKNIQEGNLEKVNLYLGRNWSLEGTVIKGDRRASEMNFPTANIIPPNLIHPRKGVYVINALFKNEKYKGIANFGERPTLDGKKLLLEAHLFDFNLDLYGKELTVEFLTFIRDEQKFESFQKLIQQIHKDIAIAKNYHLKNYNGI